MGPSRIWQLPFDAALRLLQRPARPSGAGRLLRRLQDLGYRHAIFYENTGEYLLTAELSQQSVLEDIHDLYRGRGTDRYADICVFHDEDTDLCHTVRRAEIEHFRARRGVTH